MQSKKHFWILGLFILGIPIVSNSLPTDQNQPAHIIANTANLNQKTGINIFSGNVIITQGSTKISADKIITYNNAQNKMSKAVATGSPATYQTIPKPGQELFEASANIIEYFPIKKQVIFISNGKLWQGSSTLQSDYIVYNQVTGQLTTKLYNANRTTITLQPNTQQSNIQQKQS